MRGVINVLSLRPPNKKRIETASRSTRVAVACHDRVTVRTMCENEKERKTENEGKDRQFASAYREKRVTRDPRARRDTMVSRHGKQFFSLQKR